MTNEKKPPQGAVVDVGNEAGGALPPPSPLGGALLSQAHLINALYEVEAAYGRATRAARVAGEGALMQELEARWDGYIELLGRLEPAKLFK